MKIPNFTILEAEASNGTTSPQRLQELAKTSLELARLVAANPSAPSELLRELSDSEDAIVREAVAGNPNTPTKILLQLAGEFPEAFIDNPIVPLLCLEDSNFINAVPHKAAIRLFQCEKVPASWVRKMSLPIRAMLALDSRTPETILNQLVLDEDKDPVIQAAIVQNPQAPGDFLEKCADYEDEHTRIYVARNPNTPAIALDKLANDPDAYIRFHVIANPHVPLSILRKLAGDRDSHVRTLARQKLKKRLFFADK